MPLSKSTVLKIFLSHLLYLASHSLVALLKPNAHEWNRIRDRGDIKQALYDATTNAGEHAITEAVGTDIHFPDMWSIPRVGRYLQGT